MQIDEINAGYRDGVITWPRIPMFSNVWTVNLSSSKPHLFVKLVGGNEVFNGHSLDDAIAKAKRRVDELLGAQEDGAAVPARPPHGGSV